MKTIRVLLRYWSIIAVSFAVASASHAQKIAGPATVLPAASVPPATAVAWAANLRNYFESYLPDPTLLRPVVSALHQIDLKDPFIHTTLSPIFRELGLAADRLASGANRLLYFQEAVDASQSPNRIHEAIGKYYEDRPALLETVEKLNVMNREFLPLLTDRQLRQIPAALEALSPHLPNEYKALIEERLAGLKEAFSSATGSPRQSPK